MSNIETLKELQLAREEASRAKGIQRYRDSVARAATNGMTATTDPNVKLLKQLVEPAAEAVQRWIDESSKSNRSLNKARAVAALGPHHAAFLTLQHILNGLGNKQNSVVQRLAKDIEDNVQLALAMKTDDAGPLLKHLLKEKYKGGSKHNKAYGLDRARRQVLGLPLKGANTQGLLVESGDDGSEVILDFALTAAEKSSIGQSLVEVVIGSTSGFSFGGAEGETGGLFQVVTESEFNTKLFTTTQINKIYPTKHYLRYIEQGHKVSEVVRPMYEPMLHPPVDWTGPYDGGYLTVRMPAVKSARANFLFDAHDAGVLTPLYDALNTLQRTGWKYNDKVWEVAYTLWMEGAKLPCWPERGEKKLPQKPVGCEGNENEFKVTHPEEWKKWKKAAGEVHKFNESVSRITDIHEITARMVAVSEHLKLGNPTFYEVYQADFRGRIYPVSSLIHSQGDNFCKALYLFSEGKPINDMRAAQWLQMHIANSWANDKLDKAPLEDRIKWVQDNEERILQVGNAPLENLWWLEADGSKDNDGVLTKCKPWLFLAACIEYAQFLNHGWGYVSHLPVAVDGSCNGIQHYSAAMRSREDGKLVNLVATERPADIYAVCAKKTNEILAEMVDGSGLDNLEEVDEKAFKLKEIARIYAGTITRGVAKRPTMTFPYSVSLNGIKGQLASESSELFDVFKDDPAAREKKRLALGVLSNAMLKGVKETVKSAALGMQYLQGLASIAGKSGLPIVWSLPDGFEVQQDYKKFAMRQIQTVLSGAIRVKKDKVAVVQGDLNALAGLTISDAASALKGDSTAKAMRAIVKDAKEFIKESGMLKLYRTEVEALLAEYDATFDFEAFAVSRYVKLGLKPVERIERTVVDCVKLVIRNAIALHHLREETVEEVEADTGEVKKQRKTVYIGEPTAESDVPAQVRGVGPNVIHSLDACHMRMTAKAASAEGVTSFMMIHDSYATHASDMTVLSRVLREQFVAVHEEMFFERIGKDLVAGGYVTAEQVQELKGTFLQYGDLMIEEVLRSPYFFA